MQLFEGNTRGEYCECFAIYRAVGTPVGWVLSINFLLFSLTPELHHFTALFSPCWLSPFPLISV